MASKKAAMQKTIANDRRFTYHKGDMNLSFTVNIDNPSQASDFLECLKEAETDIENVLRGLAHNAN